MTASPTQIHCLLRCLAALLTLCGCFSSASAQITTGAVRGLVRDAQGAPVAGAEVVLVSGTRDVRLAPSVTSDGGEYSVPNVPADAYRIEVTRDGFKTGLLDAILVSGADRVAVPVITLEIGVRTEIIMISGSPAILQTLTGERSAVIEASDMRSLPLVGRNFVLAVGTGVAGVTGATRLSGGGQNNLMIDGVSSMDTTNNSQMLQLNPDAVQEVRVLTQGYQAEFGRASGLQISAVTRSGSNEFSGTVYGVRTDSRWNEPSWANTLNGTTQAVSKHDTLGYAVGGPVGRPGGDNKLFFFYGHEFRPSSFGGGTRRFTLPTELELAGDFSQSVNSQGAPINQLYDASTGLPRGACSGTVANPNNSTACFPGNRVPLNRQYGVGVSILNMWKRAAGLQPNVSGARGYNYERLDPVTDDLITQPVVRADYQFSPRLRLTARYAGQRQRVQLMPGSVPGFNDTLQSRPFIHNVSSTVNVAIDSTTFIEGTWGMNVNYVGAVPVGEASNRNTLGLGDFPLLFPDAGVLNAGYYQVDALGRVNAASYDAATRRLSLPPVFGWGNLVGNPPPGIVYGVVNTNRTHDVSISLTKVLGRHTAKAGFYLNHSYKAQNTGAAGGSPFSFQGLVGFQNDPANPLDSGFGFANAMLGIFSSYSQSSRFVEGSFVYDNIEWYLQDNWRATDRLTLDYGLRFVHQQPHHDQFQQSSNFFVNEWSASDAPLLYGAACAVAVPPGAPCNPNAREARDPRTGVLLGPGSHLAIGTIVPASGDRLNGIRQAGDGISDHNYTWPFLGYAPRIGIAYDVTGEQRLVVRGSYGLFFDRPDGNSVFGQVANPPFTQNPVLRYSRLSDLASGAGLRTESVQTMFGFEYENPLQKSSQWNAGVQVALPWSSAIDFSYVGQHAWDRLQMMDINSVDFGAAFLPENQDPTLPAFLPGLATVPNDAMRPYRGLGAVVMNTAYAWNTFHSLQSSFTRRFRDSLSFGAHYTYTISSQNSVAPRLEHLPDGSYRLRADQVEAERLFGGTRTAPHVFRGNFVWDLPDYTNSRPIGRAVGAVFNDWQLSGVISAQSGAPYDVGFSYQTGSNAMFTGSPSFSARTILLQPDNLGSGCSGNQYAQFNNAVTPVDDGVASVAFRGPTGPLGGDGASLGLESGSNYLRGCAGTFVDLSLARNIRLGGGRALQLRLDAFNVFNTLVYTSRNSTLMLDTPFSTAMLAPQYLADGSLDPGRLRPQDAGFGAATGAAALRSIQAQVRFSF